jgi:hypothetical protein
MTTYYGNLNVFLSINNPSEEKVVIPSGVLLNHKEE